MKSKKTVTNLPHNLIDSKGRLFGKYDLFLPLFILICITLVFFIGRVLFQKDTYITAELFASGGEWWWDNPEPPYWLTDPLQPGQKEYDAQGNVLVEVLDTKKFEVGDRKMLWMKVRLKVAPQNKTQQFRFRREPIQVGSLIQVAPNNIKVFANVMWLEGVETSRQEIEKIITLKNYEMQPWETEAFKVGDQMRSDDGKVMAEILEKNVILSEMVTVDDRGNTHVRSNPLRRDMTVKARVLTTQSNDILYFSYFQPLKVGYFLWLPLQHTSVSGSIVAIE
jgi:hypothetical protein